MWYARIDVENQMFVIEDHDGNITASQFMPMTISPNPGREELMSIKQNREAWEKIWDLVNAANGVNKS